MKSQISVKVEVCVQLTIDDDTNLAEVLNEMEYSFKDTTKHATIDSTEITYWEEM